MIISTDLELKLEKKKSNMEIGVNESKKKKKKVGFTIFLPSNCRSWLTRNIAGIEELTRVIFTDREYQNSQYATYLKLFL